MNMEDIFARKREIQKKLAEERQRSEMIKESLGQADVLTNNMVAILSQFDERLLKLEDTILPLHRKTKDLQRLQDNIDKTVVALDGVISYHHVAHDVEATLSKAPSGQVERYLKCMERLNDAITFFSENNPDSPELHSVDNMFKMGKEKLEKEFRSQLSRQTKPISAVRVLELIQQDNSVEMELGEFLPAKTVGDLGLIAHWLTGPGKSQGFTTSYSDIRSKNLVATLEGLKDHVRGFTVNPNMKKLSISNTPKKTGTRRGRAHDKRKETGLGKGSYAPIAEEETIDVEVEPFISVVSGCAKLLTAENKVMQSIIPDKNKRKVFDTMITDSLGMIERAGNKFLSYAKQCISSHDHPSIVSIFPAIKHLKGNTRMYHDILKGCSELNSLRLPRLIGELESIGVKVLDDFTDCVKSDPEKESNMPKDGTVHELTSNAMLFVQQLSQNADIAGGMLAAQQSESQSSTEVMKKCLAQYISHVLGALKLNLENKSRVYVDGGALASVFLLNNYDFILNALDRHGLLILVELCTPEVRKIYKGFIEEQMMKYLRSWDKFQGYLSNESKGSTVDAHPGVKLRDKDKQIVKDKFKSFNDDFEELVRTHQRWAMPNHDMKREIRGMVKDRIVPGYTQFRDKFRMVQFTKNIDKYLKYTPEEVADNIEKLFDQSSA